MKRWRATIIFAGLLAVRGFSAGQGPEILNVDDKISISADAISLGHLLRLWDQATGMQSSVPPELANRKLSVGFSGLSLQEAVRRIFDGQPFDYVVIEGQGIVVVAPSQNASSAEPAPAYNEESQVTDAPLSEEILLPRAQLPRQPSFIQTPFGPVPNPHPSQPAMPIDLPPVLGAAPPIPFFATPAPVTPPAGAPNGPAQNNLFGPLQIYQDPGLPAPGAPLQP